MPTVDVELPPTLYRFIESEVEEGHYDSVDEAISAIVQKNLMEQIVSESELTEEDIEELSENINRDVTDKFLSTK